MSIGGDGVIQSDHLSELTTARFAPLGFVPKRLAANKRLGIVDGEKVRLTALTTCVLCGGVIRSKSNLEHPIPGWLQRFAGKGSRLKSAAFALEDNTLPNWQDLSLRAHSSCNSIFGKKVEEPAIAPIKAIVEGGTVSPEQMDAVFDWLDKVKSSTALMRLAMVSKSLILDVPLTSFPNWRVGLFDRFALFFRLDTTADYLDLGNHLNEAFLTTPAALVLRVRDLVIVYVSSHSVLSRAFGLGTVEKIRGELDFVYGDGIFSPGFGYRLTRLPTAKIVAQPMRRQASNEGYSEDAQALKGNGDGKIYELQKTRWVKITNTSFSSLPRISSNIGYTLARLEAVEWIALVKELDAIRYHESSFHMRSMDGLIEEKEILLQQLFRVRGGLPVRISDRIA